MPSRWVVNASPLILLAKVRHSNLLTHLAGEVVIPASVAAEVRAGPPTDPARLWLEGEGAKWLRSDVDVAPTIAA